MPKYAYTVKVVGYITGTVEADTKEDAELLAMHAYYEADCGVLENLDTEDVTLYPINE